jgi:hypothetical protein
MRGNLLGRSRRTRGQPRPSACTKNERAAQFSLGSVVATVWRNDQRYSTVLSKVYQDGDEWKETDRLDSEDLLNAAKCLEEAQRFISGRENNRRTW